MIIPGSATHIHEHSESRYSRSNHTIHEITTDPSSVTTLNCPAVRRGRAGLARACVTLVTLVVLATALVAIQLVLDGRELRLAIDCDHHHQVREKHRRVNLC